MSTVQTNGNVAIAITFGPGGVINVYDVQGSTDLKAEGRFVGAFNLDASSSDEQSVYSVIESLITANLQP